MGIDFKQAYDLKEYNTILFRVKGRNGGERFQVILRDMDWTNFNVPESNSPPIPDEGLNTKWQTVEFPLKDLEGDVDLGYLVHCAIEIGVGTTGNSPGDGIFLKDITFLKKDPPLPRIAAMPKELIKPKTTEIEREAEFHGPPLPPIEIPRSQEKISFNTVTMLGMGCAILIGGLLLRKRTNLPNGNGVKPWLLPFSRTQEFPLVQSPGGPVSMVFEINTRSWGAKRSKNASIKLRCFDQISSGELKRIRATGFDTIWMMGIWEISKKSREISQKYADDFEGSPYAIPEYKVNPELGGEEQFVDFVNRAHKLGLKILVDFVPNHMALDSTWINEFPEFFISFPLTAGDASLDEYDLLQKFPGFYPAYSDNFPERGKRVRKRIMIAYGKDPNYFPWIDTAQLDYTNPRLRIVLINLLKYWAKFVDGVRCDTVMLVLREQIKYQWHAHIPWEYYDRLFPEEFWLEAIQEVKRINPHFSFIAETYWNKEAYLQDIGFDRTYNKTLYDLLVAAIKEGHPSKLRQYLRSVSTEFLSRGLHFLENHDEDRAINVFGVKGQHAAAVCIACLPGTPLIYQGQMEGFSEKLPVQRIIPQCIEQPNNRLKEFYRGLLSLTSQEVFRAGSFYILNTTNQNIFSFFRKYNNKTVIIAVNLTGTLQTTSLSLPKIELELNRSNKYKLRDAYYPLKTRDNLNRRTVKPSYKYRGSDLIAKGLYIELGAYDSHIFFLTYTVFN